jgi:hypothetical protein
MAAPAASPIRMASQPATPWSTLSTATTAAVTPLTAPTDRSISPSSSTSTTPREIVPVAASCSTRLVRLPGVRKLGLAIAKIAQMTATPDEHGQRAQLPLAQAAAEARPGAGQAGLVGDQARIELGDVHDSGTSAGLSSPASAPVMAVTTSPELVCLASITPTWRPSRSTTMVSATANTSARLWLITTTASRWSRRVRIR